MRVLVYEAQDDAIIREQVLPLLAAEPPELVVLDPERPPELEAGATVLLYLSDAQTARFLPAAARERWRVGLLPHPEGQRTRLGFGVPPKLADAVAAIESDPDESAVDLMFCNGELVLSSVEIGDPFAGEAGDARPSLGLLWRTLTRLRATPPHRFKIETDKGKSLETAAIGMVVVEHGRGAALSRPVLEEDSAANDGMLHAIVYAPSSVAAMLLFRAKGLWQRARKRPELPEFAGHIKSASLKVTSPRGVNIRVDGRTGRSDTFEFRVTRAVLWLTGIADEHITQSENEPREVFRVQGLPTGEVLAELKDRPLPWIHHAPPEEFRTLFQSIREGARTSEAYVILTILAALLATLGLFADSAPVIIGAMILAPLMSPIVAMGMGVLRRGEQPLLREAGRTFLIGVALVLACAILAAWLTPLRTVNAQIAARLNPTLLDMGVAVFSGIAGAYAHARAEVARSLAGVAIAVALVPPLSVAGIGIGWGDWHVFWGAFLLFVTNFAGMVLAAAGTFFVLGFSPFSYSRRGLAWTAAAFVGVTALLIPAFMRMVDEHRMTNRLDGLRTAGVELRDVRVRGDRPVRITTTLVSEQPISLEQIEAIKEELERTVNRPIRLEAATAIVR